MTDDLHGGQCINTGSSEAGSRAVSQIVKAEIHDPSTLHFFIHHSSGVWRAPGSLARGKFLEGLDERSAALADYKAARSKAHENAEAWRLEAKILERIDRLEEAIAAWGHYVSLNPEDKDAKSHLDRLRRR